MIKANKVKKKLLLFLSQPDLVSKGDMEWERGKEKSPISSAWLFSAWKTPVT